MVSFCSPFVQKQSYRISISNEVTLRPCSSEAKTRSLCNTKYQTSPLLTVLGDCDFFINHSFNLPLVCPPYREDLLRYPIIKLPPSSYNVQSRVIPYLDSLQIHPMKAQILFFISFFRTVFQEGPWYFHRVCFLSLQPLKNPACSTTDVPGGLYLKHIDKSKANSLLVLCLTWDNKGCL